MTSATKRRPLPALAFLLALTLLTALVWWRVLHRGEVSAVAKPSCPTATPQNVLPQPSTVSVSVLNSTNRTGIAKAAGAVLTKDGFDVSSIGNDTGHPLIPGVAEIRYGATGKTEAALLLYYFPGATVIQAGANGPTGANIVVSLGAKYKAVAKSTAVKAAMTAAHISIAGATPTQPVSSASC